MSATYCTGDDCCFVMMDGKMRCIYCGELMPEKKNASNGNRETNEPTKED